MKNRFEGVTAFIKDKAEKATQSVNTLVESDDTKAAVAWTKNCISQAADEAVELGKRAAHLEINTTQLRSREVQRCLKNRDNFHHYIRYIIFN